jgi:hypothetical protein
MFWVTVSDVQVTDAPDEMDAELMIRSAPPPLSPTVKSQMVSAPEVAALAHVAAAVYMAVPPVTAAAVMVLLVLASDPGIVKAVALNVNVANRWLPPPTAVSGVEGWVPL